MKLLFNLHALVLVLGVALMASKAQADTCDAICTDGEDCIAAALYPYVPDTDTFATSICSAWSASGKSEKLYLIADESVWDGGYDSNPVYTNGSGTQAQIDVFVYDAMYLEYWKTQTTAVPSNYVTDASDFVSYASTALSQPDGSMLALPMLGCTNIMFYHDGDHGMETVTTLSEFLSVNPAGVYISPVPFGGTGSMLNMTGKTTIAVNYMIKGYLDNGTWPSMTTLDQSIIDSMADIAETASYYNALTGAIPSLSGVEDQYIRAGYFSEGYGRTSIGFSESMSQMSSTTRGGLELRAFPWTDNTSAPTMFYADVVGVNSSSTFLQNSGTLPFFLADLMTQQAVVQAAIAPPGGDLSYLFPARTSILNALSAQDPLYTQMKAVLDGNTSMLVNMPTTDRSSFHSFGGTVQTAVKGQFEGHCDLASTSFPGSTSQAPQVCDPLCSGSGGWIGSWTNQSPPAWPGYSACGCDICTASTPLPSSASGAEDGRQYNRN
ncbi:MAG: thiamine pyridinylase [Alphaproteobacteria bacterium]|nr:thiamine pyridinylase [Alphaproteobacteria bacterium]